MTILVPVLLLLLMMMMKSALTMMMMMMMVMMMIMISGAVMAYFVSLLTKLSHDFCRQTIEQILH